MRLGVWMYGGTEIATVNTDDRARRGGQPVGSLERTGWNQGVREAACLRMTD